MPKNDQQWLTATNVAELLGISKYTVNLNLNLYRGKKAEGVISIPLPDNRKHLIRNELRKWDKDKFMVWKAEFFDPIEKKKFTSFTLNK